MITATLTNPRHIAAANAAWIAHSGDYPSAEVFVQATMQFIADGWVESTKVDQISVGDFILRFTGAEYTAITSSADPNVAGILAILRARDSVRLGSVDAVQGVGYLVAVGLLTAERGAVVLHYDVPVVP